MRSQALNHATTLPGLLRGVLDDACSSSAFNYREAGYWRRMSTEAFCNEVRCCCLGLVKLGLKPKDTVGILAPSSPHWLIIDLAIMAAGAISVPLFPNLSVDHLLYESSNVNVKFLMVIGEEQWQLAAPHVSRYQTVITKNVLTPTREVVTYKQVLALGDELSERDPSLFALMRDRVAIDDIATIIHTSGSTGSPKGVVLTHGNLMSQVRGASERFPLDMAKDRVLSCLPLAHVFERMVVYSYLAQGTAIYFADDIKNIGTLMREVRPTVMTMVPRLIEKLYARIAKQVESALPPRQLIGRWALDQATHRDPSEKHLWTKTIADTFVYKRLRAALGGQLRCLIVGGAALPPDLGRFLTNVGVPVYTGYGLTEAAPVLSVNHPAANKLGTVGKPFPGVEVMIGEAGEILARGPNIMRGYHHDAKATAEVIDAQGWLHTGDCGRFDDDGYLIITGRMKELLKTSNGKYVCPVPIEQALGSSKLVDLAMVVAEGRRFVSCLLFPDLDFLHQFKERQGLAQLSDSDFINGDAIKEEMKSLIELVNQKLDRWEQIRSYRFVLATPTVEDELTPTMKLRRHAIEKKYQALIEEMYQEAGETVGNTT